MKLNLYPSMPLPTPEEEERIAQALLDFPLELAGRKENDRAYISPAQIKMFSRCPEQFRRRYVRGEKEIPSGAMLWGSADHEAVEDNFKQKIVTHKDLQTGDVQISFAASLDKRVEDAGGPREVLWDEKQRNMSLEESKREHAKVKDQGVQLVAEYHEQVAPDVQPTAAEQFISLTVPGVPVPIEGVIDLIAEVQRTPAPERTVEERIIDRKTKAQNRMNGEWLIQGRIYQLEKPVPIDWQLSLRPARNAKNWTPRVVTGKYLYEPVPAEVVVAQIRRAMAGIGHCYTLYGPEQPWPDALGSTWACDYCGWGPKAKGDCPWWNGDRWPSAA